MKNSCLSMFPVMLLNIFSRNISKQKHFVIIEQGITTVNLLWLTGHVNVNTYEYARKSKLLQLLIYLLLLKCIITINYYHYKNKCQNRHWYDNTARQSAVLSYQCLFWHFYYSNKSDWFVIIIVTLSFYSHSDAFLTYSDHVHGCTVQSFKKATKAL